MAHQLPSPPATASGSGGTKRSRRTEASSSSESALGQFGISNLRDRIVAPPRPLPLVTFPSASDYDSDRVKRQFGAEFEQKAWELMSKIKMGVDKPAFQVDLSFDSTAGHMTAISLFNLGFNIEGSMNPKTVYAGSDISAGCYITRNDNKPSSPMVGTLGCWVQIKVKGKDWTTMGLTCYHVLRPCLKGYMVGAAKTQVPGLSEKVDRGCMSDPAKDSACWTADIKGFIPKDMPMLEMVEHPPRIKHNVNTTNKQAHIKDLKELRQPTEAKEAELKEVLEFFNNGHQYFGRPFVASGYLRRTKTNGRLDWALIQPFGDSRVGGNALPTLQDWRSKGYMEPQMPAKQDNCVLEPQGISIHDCVKDVTAVHDKVFGFKMGASTRCTAGQLSWVKTTCTITEEKYMAGRSQKERRSTEYVFAPIHLDPTIRFGNRGDSGAVVFDKLGRVMGLLFTGERPQQCAAGYSLVTPIEDVFADIKEFSCGQVEDIRLLGEEEDTVMAST
ncbi:hypothetical protein B0T25DRAFT_500520 [Lasiosphaeria hispida]|uniref:Uncharacterized protein n=1 Tax=Lasiosphaeria hispida TaxID=260671 RepID=A0AAJ0HGU7_9PEZI|nr:hypothetical protein B0T25DRAFT_500520 [Lasiosphaeria hispida]